MFLLYFIFCCFLVYDYRSAHSGKKQSTGLLFSDVLNDSPLNYKQYALNSNRSCHASAQVDCMNSSFHPLRVFKILLQLIFCFPKHPESQIQIYIYQHPFPSVQNHQGSINLLWIVSLSYPKILLYPHRITCIQFQYQTCN